MEGLKWPPHLADYEDMLSLQWVTVVQKICPTDGLWVSWPAQLVAETGFFILFSKTLKLILWKKGKTSLNAFRKRARRNLRRADPIIPLPGLKYACGGAKTFIFGSQYQFIIRDGPSRRFHALRSSATGQKTLGSKSTQPQPQEETRFGRGRRWRLCRLPKTVVRQTQQQQESGGKVVPMLTGWCCVFPSLQDQKLWSRAQIWRAPFFCRGSGVTRASDRLPCCPCRSLAFVLFVIFCEVCP